ncbi:MAG: TIGR00180 family glycosyltransferase [Spirochaetia bacterium]|nr:TIGR00180 family glycosyltransferase [Spirochaetia bacterium]
MKTNQNLLTIVMPLKGRHFYTEFWVSYALKARLPFKLILADGSKEDEIGQFMGKNAKLLEGLDVEYLRFPFDATYADYYKKVLNTLSMVKTKYVVLLDNDTFPVPSSLGACIAFMESNADHSCCRGAHVDFDFDSNGEIICDDVYLTKDDRTAGILKSFDQANAIERIESWSHYTHILYYNVHRMENMVRAWRTIVNNNFMDLTMTDFSIAVHALIGGKTRVLDGVYMMRHRGSPESVSAEMYRRLDIMDRVLSPRWTQEWAAGMEEVCDRICTEDAHQVREEVAERIRMAVKTYVSDRIFAHLQRKRTSVGTPKYAVRQISRQDIERSQVDVGIYDLLKDLGKHPSAREALVKTGV